jgi:hypothetical protein
MSHVDGVDDGVGYGVSGKSSVGNGIYGLSQSSVGYGVVGENKSSVGYGVYGKSDGSGVYGEGNSGAGVVGQSQKSVGVAGSSRDGFGVVGSSGNWAGLYGESTNNYAAILDGKVKITGNLEKAGGSFKIDHPLDPANKYLCHSFVESPDMKNVYDGVVVLDDKGEAEIDLPDWSRALNKDFRYQLTAIGAPGPNLYIAKEISEATTNTKYSSSKSSSNKNKNKNNNSRFKIAGGTSGMKVSWQVTGIRKDPWANANRIQVEEDKPAKEQGYYLHPDLYGQPEERGISHLLFPKEEQELIINKNKTNL